jgi:glucose-1-phosphate cytidylyltransferase
VTSCVDTTEEPLHTFDEMNSPAKTENTAKVPVFILAGGMGTRISEESALKPKPMIEIGGDPILIHLMRWYYSFGFNDFVICAGYRAWDIKQYFLNYAFRKADLEIDHRAQLDQPARAIGETRGREQWRVRVLNTGENCMTGGRVARALAALKNESFENFAVTYGDGLSDVNLKTEFQSHLEHQKIGTVLGVHPSARFGELVVGKDGTVDDFSEKPQSNSDWINGGFFFFKRAFEKYVANDPACILERAPLMKLAQDGELKMFSHPGFWHPMDTLRDKNMLEAMLNENRAKWIVQDQR